MGLARVGADDFMPRGSSIGELHARLRALARRGTNGSTPSRLQFEELALDVGEQSARIGERAVRLTRTEFDFAPAGNTLRVYMGYLRRKLEANAERRLLHTVRGVSYVLREP
jgi:two-component system, OmpR family, response regulator MprA